MVVPLLGEGASSYEEAVCADDPDGAITSCWGQWLSKKDFADVKEAVQEARLKLPYTDYKKACGRDHLCPDGADEIDLFAHSSLALAAGMQGRRQVCSAKGRRRLVEKGLSPEEHVVMGLNLVSPLMKPVPVAADLDLSNV